MKRYSLLAKLLQYPDFQLNLEILETLDELKSMPGIDNHNFQLIENYFKNTDVISQEEFYISNFDIKAVCSLDIGHILFGEDLKRGQFLYQIQSEQNHTGVDCGTELADHLPNLLKLVSVHSDREFVEELTVSLVLPAMKLMIKEFKEEANIYKHILELIFSSLEDEFRNSDFEPIHLSQVDKCAFVDMGCGVNFSKQKNY